MPFIQLVVCNGAAGIAAAAAAASKADVTIVVAGMVRCAQLRFSMIAYERVQRVTVSW